MLMFETAKCAARTGTGPHFVMTHPQSAVMMTMKSSSSVFAGFKPVITYCMVSTSVFYLSDTDLIELSICSPSSGNRVLLRHIRTPSQTLPFFKLGSVSRLKEGWRRVRRRRTFLTQSQPP